MSDSTPILISLPLNCAFAVPMPNAPATASASSFLLIAFIITPPRKTEVGSETTFPVKTVVGSETLNTQILVQLVHVPVELGVGNHVDDASMLHHVVPIRNRCGEPEILLDEQDREALRLQRPDRAPDLLDDHG